MPGGGHLLTLAGALVPVFTLVALGYAVRVRGMLTPAGGNDLNRLVYWLALPAQIVVILAGTDVRRHFVPATAAAPVAAFALGLVAVWLASRRRPPDQVGTLISGCTRGNAAFIGLPVMQLVSHHLPDGDGVALVAAYSVLLGVMMVCFNVGAVIGFLLPHHGIGRGGLLRTLAELPRNPLIVACAIGVLISVLRPGLLDGIPAATLGLLGSAAIPLALLVTGSQLDPHALRRNTGLLALVALTKLVLMPAATLAIGWAIGLQGDGLIAAVVLMASPTAVAGVPMARMLGGDADLMAAIVVATTMLAPLSMLGWLTVMVM